MVIKHAKRYSTLLIMTEMPIKTTIRYHYKLTGMEEKDMKIQSVGKDRTPLKLSYSADRTINWYNHYGITLGTIY